MKSKIAREMPLHLLENSPKENPRFSSGDSVAFMDANGMNSGIVLDAIPSLNVYVIEDYRNNKEIVRDFMNVRAG
jgi:hypothetical protein